MATSKPSYTVLCNSRNTALVALGNAVETRLSQLIAAAPSKAAAKSSTPFQFKLLLRPQQAPETASISIDDPATGVKQRVIGEAHAVRYMGRVLFPVLFSQVTAVPEEEQEEAKEQPTAAPAAAAAAAATATSDSLASVYYAAGDLGRSEAALLQAQVDFFLEFAQHVVGTSYAVGSPSDLCGAIADQLNQHLSCRAFLAGPGISLADYVVLGALQRHPQWSKLRKNPDFPHIRRWVLSLSRRPEVDFALLELDPKLKEQRLKELQKVSRAARMEAEKGRSHQALGAQHYDLDLPHTEQGVVTRFPPEPSGYLHIGHAKALLLNYFFKERYHGRMLMRFDDTNPAKEKDEYEQSIVEDIRTLGVEWDGAISHTSDFFPQLLEFAALFIKKGLAYVDDTPKEQLRAWRLECVESPGRNRPVEENLKLWQEMQDGTEKGLQCVLRLKMDMKNANGCLRDPVAYRCNLTPHHRTGSRFKAYPTYDFACPIVDCLEGVTHVLRTTEYRDRDAQFAWLLDLWDQAEGRTPEGSGAQAPRRRPHTWGYSRLNFVRTTLSKRHLTWFVINGRVDGWDDPRFPTVRGILRRGMQVEALRQFMIEQGASKNVNTMHWDKIWAINRLHLDPVVHRYNAVFVPQDDLVFGQNHCVMELDADFQDQVVEVPVLPKDRQGQQKRSLRHHRVYLEPEDAKSLAPGEEITLITWGNVIVESVDVDPQTEIVRRVKAKLNPNGDFRSTQKKISWVATKEPVPVTIVEFDHLLRVEKLDDVPTFEEAVNEQTRFESLAWGEQAMADIKEDQVIQVMRRGFFRCDRAYDPKRADPNIVLFAVPDGHIAGSMSTLSSKVALQGF